MDDIFRELESELSLGLEWLEELVRIPTISSRGRELPSGAERTREICEAAGLSAEVMEGVDGGPPVVWAEGGPDDAEETVLFYGHYDVQPPEPLEAWGSPPFETTERDGAIYGRGTADNKGQFLAHLMAVRAWRQTAGELPVRVRFLIEGEEEIGSPHLGPFLEAHRDRFAADVCYAADGGMHESGRPTLYLGFRGILYLILEATGPNRDLHSGIYGGIVPNPAWRLVRLLSSMRTRDGRIALEALREGLPRPTTTERRFLEEAEEAWPGGAERLAERLGLERLVSEEGVHWLEQTQFWPTLNLNGLDSGATGEGTKTIIPGLARAKLDVRLVAGQEPDRVHRAIRDHVARHPDGPFRCDLHHAMPPASTDPDHPSVGAAIRALRAGYGDDPVVIPRAGFSVPLAAIQRVLDCPLLLVPYSYAEDRIHAPDEHLRIRDFLGGMKSSVAFMKEVAARRDHAD